MEVEVSLSVEVSKLTAI